jgi:hypothetical protein
MAIGLGGVDHCLHGQAGDIHHLPLFLCVRRLTQPGNQSRRIVKFQGLRSAAGTTHPAQRLERQATQYRHAAGTRR